MSTIKSFVYLDEDKMYSLSSQIFEGITEYLIGSKSEQKEEQENQKGPVGSGRILADIIRKDSSIQEKKFLHDYSYHLFEQYLCDQKKVLNVEEQNIKEFRASIPVHSFIKVKGKAVFNDINMLRDTMKNFNELGLSLTLVTHHQQIEENQKQIQAAQAEIKDRNQRAAFKEKVKPIASIEKLAKEQNLQMDQNFLNALSFILSYGFQDQFETQLIIADTIFSANLKRGSLREDEAILIRKYSRRTEREFTIFGIVTQSSRDPQLSAPNELPESPNMKEAIMNLVAQISNIETAFTGRLANEIIIDPIAIYTEL